MKKLLLLILCIATIVGMTACGGKEPVNSPDTQETKPFAESNVPTTDAVSSGTAAPATSDLFEKVTKISRRDIYINYQRVREREVVQSSVVFYNSRKDLVILTYDEEKYTGELSGVLPLLNDGRIPRDFRSKTNLDFYDAADVAHIMDIKTTENKRVNNIDTILFTGSVRSTDNIDCFVYGYAFIFDDTPCVLAGVVTTREQEQTRIHSIIEEVDTMITTVRSQR